MHSYAYTVYWRSFLTYVHLHVHIPTHYVRIIVHVVITDITVYIHVYTCPRSIVYNFVLLGYPTTKEKVRVRASTGRTEGNNVHVRIIIMSCKHNYTYLRRVQLYCSLVNIF